jgi:ADP-ribosylglycohydrolase
MYFPNPNFLFYTAMADAYGMGAEYLKLDRLEDAQALQEVLKFERYVAHPRYGSHAPGAAKYTDDTEMSVANTLVLLGKKPAYTKLDFASAYVNEFVYGGRRKGYSRGFQAILEKVGTGEDLLHALIPDSDKNGAAMRAVPFGVLPHVHEVLDAATVSASVTHDTAIGLFSSRAIALAAHFAIYERPNLIWMRQYIQAHLPKEDKQFLNVINEPWDGSPVVGNDKMGPVGLTTVNAVLQLVTTQDSLMGMLRTACEWGGDVDSVASIAWGIASARFQYEQLPEFLTRDLEYGSPRTGEQRLRDLGILLFTKYSKD